MGIFSNEAHYGYQGQKPFSEDTLESIMLDSNVEPYEGEDLMEGALDCCITMQENYNMFMTQIALSESSYFERTGELMVYNEGMLGDMVNGIKNFLKKIWEKIKALFKRFMMVIDSYTKSDKEFVQKYKKEIYSGKSLDDFTFKGYKFSKEAFNKTSAAIEACEHKSLLSKELAGSTAMSEKDLKTNFEDKYDDLADNFRGKIIGLLGGKSGSFTTSEFSKELHAIYRSGEESKEALDDKDITAMGGITGIAGELMSSKDTKKTMNDTFKAAKKSIDAATKEVENRQKEFFKNQPLDDKDSKASVKVVNAYNQEGNKVEDNVTISGKEASNRAAKTLNLNLRAIRDTKTCLLTIEGACLNALKERSRQNKAIIIKYVSHKPKSEAMTNLIESANQGYTPFFNVQMK